MPYKEINDLRKKGFLEDATRMAEHEYAESPGKLEAIALFWCLNAVSYTHLTLPTTSRV